MGRPSKATKQRRKAYQKSVQDRQHHLMNILLRIEIAVSIFNVLVEESSVILPRIRPQTYSGDSDRTKRRKIHNNAKSARGSKPLT